MESNNNISVESKSWSGFWSGLVWFVAGFILILITQMAAVVILGTVEAIHTGEAISNDRINQLFTDGEGLGIAFIILLPLLTVMLAFAIKVRRKRSFFEYLAFNRIEIKTLLLWLIATAVLLVLFEIITRLFERPVPEWVMEAYESTDNYTVLFLGMVVFGPLSEELLFRGYIYRAWAESIIGPYAACILLSILWAVIHLQYEWFETVMIFFLGLFLGWARLKSGSIYPPVVIHMFWNLVSYIQVGQHMV